MASSQSSSSSSQSSAFSGINDPQALAALQTLISQLASGGSDAMKSQAASKKAGIDQINAALGDYKKSAAFQDALDLVTASLDKAMLAQKPAITRAVQGAGTSASSMQGLLAENAAESAATQAGALGAEQAKSYGQITANLLSTLMSATSTTDPAVSELLKALDLSKVSTQQSTSNSFSSGSSSDPVQQQQSSGGGSRTMSSGGGSMSSGGSSSSGGGLFDGYDPYAYTQQSTGGGGWLSSGGNNDASVWNGLQISNDGSEGPTYAYTEPSGGSYSFQNTSDPYGPSDNYYTPDYSFNNLYGTESAGDLYDFQFSDY